MAVLVLVSATILVACFAIAATSKIQDFTTFHLSLTTFGIPNVLHRPAAIATIGVEALIVLMLVTLPVRWGGMLSLLLLSTFVAVSLSALRRGHTPECQCFGNLSGHSIGRGTFIRNAALIGLSAVLLFEPRTIVSILNTTPGTEIALATVILTNTALAIVLIMVLQRYGESLRKLDVFGLIDPTSPPPTGPPIGHTVPELLLSSHENTPPESLVNTLVENQSEFLVLLSTSCGGCDELIPVLERSAESGSRGTVLVSGTQADNRARYATLNRTLWDVYFTDQPLNSRFAVAGFPTLIPLDGLGVVKGEALLGNAVISDHLSFDLSDDISLKTREANHVRFDHQALGPAS